MGLRSLEFGDPSPPSSSSSSRRSSMCNLRLRHLCSIGAFIITYTILGVPSRKYSRIGPPKPIVSIVVPFFGYPVLWLGSYNGDFG